jgi:hypothetical protein
MRKRLLFDSLSSQQQAKTESLRFMCNRRKTKIEITNFSPLIMTNDAENVGKVLEELGFVKRHEKKDVTETKDSGFRMKDAEGQHVSVAQVNQMPRDVVAVQINVHNFDETMELLKAHGFKNMSGEGKVIDTGSSKTAMMLAPSGFAINVVYHTAK